MADGNDVPRYTITLEDGTPVGGAFVLLRIDTDYVARKHVMAYAADLEAKQPALARHLRDRVAEYAHPAELATYTKAK